MGGDVGAATPRKSPSRADGAAGGTTPSPSKRRPPGGLRRRIPSLRTCALVVISAWFGLVVGSYRTIASHHEEELQPQGARRGRRSSSSSLRARRDAGAKPRKNATTMGAAEPDANVRAEERAANGAVADGAARKARGRREENVGAGKPRGAILTEKHASGKEPRAHENRGKRNDGSAPLIAPGELPRCAANRGPNNVEALREMVYWKNIPSDSSYVSPYLRQVNLTNPADRRPRKYLHFELDDCGFNNNRIVFETALVLAHAMGRTLVVPPRRKMYGNDVNETVKPAGYLEYYQLEDLGRKYDGIDLISTEEFLRTEVLTGNLRDLRSGRPVRPPGGLTNWDGVRYHPFRRFVRSLSVQPEGWDPEECLISLPARPGPSERAENEAHRRLVGRAMDREPRPPLPSHYKGEPTAVDADPEDRFREIISERTKTCLYTDKLREARVLNFPVTATYRFMMHFYAAIYFEDWRADLYYKRLVRDQVRFRDDVVCAAARIVEALRTRARQRSNGNNPGGAYDAFHVRRTDFQELYEGQANETGQMIFDTSKEWITPDKRRTVYIATDERNKTFFEPLEGAYDVRYLDDYSHLLGGVSSNLHPMIEMMVAARGEIFVGMFWSTFTGYINRLRGYYSQSERLDGHEKGELRHSHHYNSVTFVQKNEYLVYKAVKRPAWYREFPAAWRDIDRSVGKMDEVL